MGGEYVAEIGTVQDILKCGQDLDPNGRSPFGGYESAEQNQSLAPRKSADSRQRRVSRNNSPARVEENEVRRYRHERSKELSSDRKYQ